MKITSFVIMIFLGAHIFAQKDIAVKPLNFDSEYKRWEFQIGDQKGFWNLSESKDIAKEYKSVDELVKSNKLLAKVSGNLALLGTEKAGKFEILARIPLSPKIDNIAIQGGSFKDIAFGMDQKVSDFSMSKFAITQSFYELIMGVNPSIGSKDADSPDRPVENMTWMDAIMFCNRLSIASGLSPVYTIGNGDRTYVFQDLTKNGWRLPTLAEYEFAARGGNLSKGYYFAGSNKTDTVAWTALNSGGKTHPVGKKAPNELGIFDLTGNVSTWTWNVEGAPLSYNLINNVGPLVGGTYNRAIMGGSFKDSGLNSSLALGSHVDPWEKIAAQTFNYIEKSDAIGIRLVRSGANTKAYEVPYVKDIQKYAQKNDPDKLLVAVQSAGMNRFELDKALRALITTTWTTDPSKVYIKSVKASTKPALRNVPWADIPGIDIEIESQDPLFKWSGVYTFYWENQNLEGLFKAGKLHAEIDWEIVPLDIKQYAHRISDIRFVAQSKKGIWKRIDIKFNDGSGRVPLSQRGKRPKFPAFLANSFELGKRNSPTKLSYAPSIKVEGNSEIQSFFMTQAITEAQWQNVLGTYELGNFRREGRFTQFYETIGKDGVVGFFGKAYISPSILLTPRLLLSYKAAAIWCNAMSVNDGLEPVYIIDPNSWFKVVADLTKNGWRLPTADEYEWARQGGKLSQGFKTYSGSNNLADLIVPYSETEGEPWISGVKKANELGLYDLTGNIKEWVNDLSTSWADAAMHLYVGLSFREEAKDFISPEIAANYLYERTDLELVREGSPNPGVGFRAVRPDGKPVIMPKKERKPAETKTESKVEPKTEVKTTEQSNIDMLRTLANGKLQKLVKKTWSDYEIQLENTRLDREGNVWSIEKNGDLYKIVGKDKKLIRSGVADLAFGPKNQLIYIATTSQKIEWSYEGSSWSPIETKFQVTQITVGNNNHLWALSQPNLKANGKIYHYLGTSGWEEVAGLANSIAVDNDGMAWITNEANELSRYSSYAKQFYLIAEKAIKVYASNSGKVFVLGTWNIGEGYQLLEYSGREPNPLEPFGGGAMSLGVR